MLPLPPYNPGTSLRQTAGAFPEGVHLRESWLYMLLFKNYLYLTFFLIVGSTQQNLVIYGLGTTS